MKPLIILIICLTSIVVNTNNAFSQIITGNLNDSIVNCNTGEVTYGEKTHKGGLNLDVPIGIALIRNQISPSLNIGLKVVYDNHVFIPHYRSFYFFEKNPSNNFDMYIYSFWGLKYLYQIDEFNAKGLGISYLTKDSRNHFQKNTFLFSYIREIKGLQITPSLICTNNFKTVFPSITIGFKLF